MPLRSLADRFSRLLGGKRNDTTIDIWQDREIRFDLSTSLLQPRTGEFTENVEDSKGRHNETGLLYVTNLRTIWTSTKKRRLNMSVGHACVVDVLSDESITRLRGEQLTMRILTRFARSSFEFIFTCSESDTRILFNALKDIISVYSKTKLHREIAIRDLLVMNGELILLTEEEVIDKRLDVAHITSDQLNAGTFFITNVRIVWNASTAHDLNISIPYPQMKSAKLRDSKFGKVFVIETVQRSGGYVLGFCVDKESDLNNLQIEVQRMKATWDQNPSFGISKAVTSIKEMAPIAGLSSDRDSVETDRGDVFAMYCDDDDYANDLPPVYDPTLGLAIEPLRDGMAIKDLWEVV